MSATNQDLAGVGPVIVAALLPSSKHAFSDGSRLLVFQSAHGVLPHSVSPIHLQCIGQVELAFLLY